MVVSRPFGIRSGPCAALELIRSMSSSSTASQQTDGKGGVRSAASAVVTTAAALGLATGLLVGAHLLKRSACRGVSPETTPLHKGPGGATTVTAAGDGVDDAKKVAVVTGGSRGIGAAISRKLAEAGYTVAVVYQSNSKAADSVVASIVANGGQAAAFKCNVAVEADIIRLFAEVKDRLGECVLDEIHRQEAHKMRRCV